MVLLTNKPCVFGQHHESSQVFGTNGVNSNSSWCLLRFTGATRFAEVVYRSSLVLCVRWQGSGKGSWLFNFILNIIC